MGEVCTAGGYEGIASPRQEREGRVGGLRGSWVVSTRDGASLALTAACESDKGALLFGGNKDAGSRAEVESFQGRTQNEPNL